MTTAHTRCEAQASDWLYSSILHAPRAVVPDLAAGTVLVHT